MEKVELFGLNEEVVYNSSEVFSYNEYDQAAITIDNRLIAFDEAINAWVQLSGNADNM